MLNIIAGKEDYDSGAVVFRNDLRVGYLEQMPHYPDGLTVLQACFYSPNETVRLIAEYEQAMASGDHSNLEDILLRMDNLKAWDYEQRTKQILGQLKIHNFDQKVETLSGGQLKRVALANVLITDPELIILDEPTNHLDLEMTEWLEGYLSRANISILMVTHDRYMEQIRQKQGVSQGVLFPEILQLPASEAAVLQGIMDDLAAVGFDLSNLGGGSYAINGIPSGIEGLNPVELVRNMLHTAMEKGNDVKEEIQNILALTLARAAAIVYGQVLSNEEMVSLVDNLFACPSPNYTPDGKTVLTTIKEEDIERLFK